MKYYAGTLKFDACIVCTGSFASFKDISKVNSYELAKGFKHKIVPVTPALCGLRSDESFFDEIAGVRAEGAVSLWIDDILKGTQRGEIQFTDYGISGIPTFCLSRMATKALLDGSSVFAHIDFLPEISFEELIDKDSERRKLLGKASLYEYTEGMLNRKLMDMLIKKAGLNKYMKVGKVSVSSLEKLYSLIKDLKVHIVGDTGFLKAQVCAGGVDLSELDDNLMSKLCENVYFAGEIIDVDGICGGFNLHWAFMTGFIAGKSAALGGENES